MTAPSTSDDPTLAGLEVGEAVVTYGTLWTRRAKRRSDERAVLVEMARSSARRVDWAQSCLLRQARILEAVDHPRLPRPLEVRRDGDRAVLVFPDHGGHRLDEILTRARNLPLDATLAIGIQVAGAVGAMHRATEVHGLVRPALIEITDQGQLYLHGAGQLPRGAERGRDELLELPQFMAPEMILGDEPSEGSDVFLLGLLLYTCLAGQHPFDGDETGITQRIRHTEAPRLSDVREGGTPVPRDVEQIVRQCLSKRLLDRHLDMSALQTDLVRALRKRTAEPEEALIARALARAGLAEDPPPVRRRHLVADALSEGKWLPWAAGGAAVLAFVGIVAGFQSCGDEGVVARSDPQGIVSQPAQLRLLAHPWAEVFVDGERVDVTPIGRPVEVPPGRHVVAFRHPNAPEITRTVEVIAGQTVLLDVQMQIVRPEASNEAPDLPAGEDATP